MLQNTPMLNGSKILYGYSKFVTFSFHPALIIFKLNADSGPLSIMEES